MKYVSTRGKAQELDFEDVMLTGLARDGGLYLPKEWPNFTNKDLIKIVKVFDVYEGENIPEGKKSIALNITIQSLEKTLKDDDLDRINRLIISSVEEKTGAKIRS